MIYQTESKLQGWRALAVFEDGTECLIFVGRSTTQVRTGYAAAFAEMLDEEERARVRSISLQVWQGAPDRGQWLQKGTLNVPGRKPTETRTAARTPVEGILPFRLPDVPTAAELLLDPEEATRDLAPTA